MLVIREYRNIHGALKFIFNVIALRGRYIFQIDSCKGFFQKLYGVNEFILVFGIDYDRDGINIAKFLVQCRLAFHNRHSCCRTDIAKAKDTCPIRNNSYYITSPGKGKGQIFILLDFQTWCGNTWCIHGSQIMGIFHIGIQSGFDNLMFCMSQFKGFFFKLVGIHIFLLKNKNYSSNAGRFLP